MNHENHPIYVSMMNALIKNPLYAQMLLGQYNELLHQGLVSQLLKYSFHMMPIPAQDPFYLMNPFASQNIYLNCYNSPIQVNNNLHFLQVQPVMPQTQQTIMNSQSHEPEMNYNTFLDGLPSKHGEGLTPQRNSENIVDAMPKHLFCDENIITPNDSIILSDNQHKKDAAQAFEKKPANLQIAKTKSQLTVDSPKTKLKNGEKTNGNFQINKNNRKQYSGIKTKRRESYFTEVKSPKSSNMNEKAKKTKNQRMKVSELLEDSFLRNIGKNIPTHDTFEAEVAAPKIEDESILIHVDYKPTNDSRCFMTYNFKSSQEEQTGEKVITDAINQCANINFKSYYYLSENCQDFSSTNQRKVWSPSKYKLLCLSNPKSPEIETVLTTINLIWPTECAIPFSEDLALEIFALNNHDLCLTENYIKMKGCPFQSFCEWKASVKF